MASLELRSERYRIVFRFGGKKFQTPLKTTEPKEAQGCLARLEENLRLVERGRLVPPPDADLATFLLSDGQVAQEPTIVNDVLSLDGLVTDYMAVHSNGALEANTLATREMHLRHIKGRGAATSKRFARRAAVSHSIARIACSEESAARVATDEGKFVRGIAC
jgi:hypothetical protein